MSDTTTRAVSPPQRWYRRLVGADAERGVAANGLRQVAASSLQSVGDQVVNAKTVLPWLLAALGTPAAFTGLLVPVRESGSMLPQAALTPWVTSRPRRTTVWVLGATGQAGATAGLAATAALAEGAVAGVLVVLLLAVFAVARSLCSLAGKDVLGRTVPKGERGRINGVATVVAGVVALTLGLGLRLVGDVGASVIAVLLVAAALAWTGAALVYSRVREPGVDEAEGAREEGPGNDEPRDDGPGWAAAAWSLLRADAPFRRFVVVRALLLVSALAPPFFVQSSASSGDTPLSGLGAFVVASGLASVLGGRVFGAAADRSSRLLMAVGAAVASLVVLGVAAALAAGGGQAPGWLLAGAFFVVSLVHVGVRVGRKTYVVDMADGDRRTEYVAVANTTMGVLLLGVGALTAALATLGVTVALLFLGGLGLVGAVLGRSLPEVSSRR
ncbi:MFS transporter [Phycicoccus sp. BSK3Z-2]|uniref:MFS transporter n=1 Tax=Phycicoccus avicenniae TaxID=2828860 RepID=A0A941D8F7_9MICO|nr:MFS transporter [Phycicoccus avicenniae]MBR7743491.1 MFS transporter [Phycicoccus avicenniae]